MTSATALVGATLLHLGFQAVVTIVVYPGFATVRDEDWPVVDAAHTRRIGPVVAVVYGALVVAVATTVAAGPSPAGWVAVGAVLVAVLVTAAVAAPAHGRLSSEPRRDVLPRLLVADRVRLVAAAVAAVAALVAAG